MFSKLQVLCLALILALAGGVSAQVADPAPSPVLAYEGRLTESNALVTGSRPFVFSILDSNGNELWNSGAQNLNVVEGLYGVVLGATGMPVIPASLTLKANLHLHVLADGVALSPDISLIPALQASTSWSVTGPFLGDISGTQQGISVDKLKGIPIDLAGSDRWTSADVRRHQLDGFHGLPADKVRKAPPGRRDQRVLLERPGPRAQPELPEPPARPDHKVRQEWRAQLAPRERTGAASTSAMRSSPARPMPSTMW